MTRPALGVVVGEGSATVREVLSAAEGFADPVLLYDPEDEQLAPLAEALGDVVACVPLSLGDLGPLLSCHQERPLRGITTFSESLLRVTADAAHALGLPFHSPSCARSLTDKARQRDAMEAAGLGIGHRRVEGPAEAEAAVRAFGRPCVVKPLHGTGGRQTRRVAPEDTEVLHAAGDGTYPAVVEVLLAGAGHPVSDLLADVVSVEVVQVAGEVRHTSLTDRFVFAPPFRESGSVWPSQLPADLQRDAAALAHAALKALGVEEGTTHTELKLTPDGFRVVEVNGRLGGYVGELTSMAAGTGAVELSLRASCALPVPALRATAVAGVRLLAPPEGARRLVERVPVEALRAVPGVTSVRVTKRAGATIDTDLGSDAAVGSVWMRANTWSELEATQARLEEICGRGLFWE